VPEDPTEMFVEPKDVPEDPTEIVKPKDVPEEQNDIPEGGKTKLPANAVLSDCQFVVPTGGYQFVVPTDVYMYEAD
jgi:hypothetical protein